MCALTKQDRVYTALPLYHSSAVMMGVGGGIISGATVVLRKKFSVKAFSEDCVRHKVTAIQYIGELCRYLKDAPPAEAESCLDIRIAFGNGLRADVWEGFQKDTEFVTSSSSTEQRRAISPLSASISQVPVGLFLDLPTLFIR